MSTPLGARGSNIGPNSFYELQESERGLTLEKVSRSIKSYSPLETLQSIDTNLDRLKTDEKTLDCVNSILNGYIEELKNSEAAYKKSWRHIFDSPAIKKSKLDAIYKNWNKAIALSVHIQEKWNKIGGRIPDIYSGTTSVCSVHGQEKVKLDIVFSEAKYGYKIFKAYVGNSEVGSIKIDWFRTLQNKYGSETHLGNLDQEPSYSDGYYLDDFSNSTKEQRLNVICIESINTRFQAYKGVGSVLMQAAMEYGYSKGCEGRLLTNAVRNASPFYYKLGMRSRHDIDNKMLKSVAKKPRLSHDFGKIDMWMTPLAIQEWKEKIREKPLFVSTSQHLGSKAVTASNVLDLFSEKDRKIDHDLINNFLKRIKQEEKTAHLDPEKAYDFLNLFPQETRIVAMGKLMKVLSEHPKDFTNLLEQKFLEIAGTTLDKRLFSFAGQEGVQAVAARMQTEESPLREIDNEFLSLFSKEDKDQNFKTIIKLEGWIMSQENLDRDNYNRYYLYRDRVVNLLNLFPEEIRIAASNKIMQLSDTDLELFNDKGFLKIQLLENIKKTPSENRLKFLENYLSLKTQ